MIAADAIEAARALAMHPETAAALDDLARRVRDLHALEASYPRRIRAARESAGEKVPPLSRAARDEIAAGGDAHQRVLELQRRRCRRARTAVAVIETLLPDARYDLRTWEWLARESDAGPPRDVVLEIVRAKRALNEAMREFVQRFGDRSGAPPC